MFPRLRQGKHKDSRENKLSTQKTSTLKYFVSITGPLLIPFEQTAKVCRRAIMFEFIFL